VQVTLHQLSDHINFLKEVDVGRLQDVQGGQDVFVLEEAEHLNLPIGPLTGDKVLEDVRHLLEGYPLPIPRIRHCPDYTKSSISNRSVGCGGGEVNGGGGREMIVMRVVMMVVMVTGCITKRLSGSQDGMLLLTVIVIMMVVVITV